MAQHETALPPTATLVPAAVLAGASVALIFLYELLVTQKLLLHGLLAKGVHARAGRIARVRLRYRDVLRSKLLYAIRFLRRDNRACARWAAALHGEIGCDLARRGQPRDVVLPVPVVTPDEATAKGFYRDYVRSGNAPVVMRDVASKARSLWTKAYLAETHGSLPMTYRTRLSDQVTHHSLGEFLARGEPDGVVPSGPVLDRNEAMLDQLGVRRFGGHMCGWLGRFALGPTLALMFIRQTRGRGRMHCEESNNLYFMLRGRKKVTMVHPEHSWLVYPFATAGASAWFSSVTEDRPGQDLSLYRYAPRFEVELEPGDVMMIPSWMWHQFDNLTDDTIAVATRWLPFGGVTNRYFRMIQLLSPTFWRQLYLALSKQTESVSGYARAGGTSDGTAKASV